MHTPTGHRIWGQGLNGQLAGTCSLPHPSLLPGVGQEVFEGSCRMPGSACGFCLALPTSLEQTRIEDAHLTRGEPVGRGIHVPHSKVSVLLPLSCPDKSTQMHGPGKFLSPRGAISFGCLGLQGESPLHDQVQWSGIEPWLQERVRNCWR